jgi:uncharacterized protein
MKAPSKKMIWVLQGARAGDNAQARELAKRFDAQVAHKDLTFNRLHMLPNWALGATTATLRDVSRENLEAPWPDMVIATGKRMAPVARWIKDQSGGRSKIVMLGRPRARLSAFDLVISTPQYDLPLDANVVEVPLPFVASAKIDSEGRKHWQEQWRHLPKPLVGVMVGNGKYPLVFGPAEIHRLTGQLNKLAPASLLLIASPRTAEGVVARIGAGLNVPHVAYARFDKNNNPYRAAIAMCDRFVVTSDSISMISELINSGKPVAVFKLGAAKVQLRWSGKRGFGAWLARTGLLQPPRDVSAMVDSLIERRLIGELGAPTELEPHGRDDQKIMQRLALLIET